ncbi:hypothetical protein K493DRAFT_376296 [Basidiobolus meristosporus CBS 931.73]|uniref:Aminoglycoside phosphotransferase domain-containing protein n=1 Tax=Basidiobolus meristosporus CBS 931.73 TaxID=1314790 RepID=A0A1Y1Z544_9FUNG|nr:hypothetical protein K493DRAFT_376296 [Basidiobolus meristosporus CBS 931.73]|eukprot:ORY05370.1 hypothetical protein K493DRAFT_376296 [Basidiobolus meristosporus CBS 931.73]
MPLFNTIPVDIEQVRRLVLEHWGAELGECIKSSQNHTYQANKGADRFIVRVTPDPDSSRFESIELELALLKYLHDNELPVCQAIPSLVTSTAAVRSGTLILSLFNFATGEPVNYTDWTWMTNKEIVVGLGRWFALQHKLTRQFAHERPELASHVRHWKTLHDGVLSDVEVDEQDSKTASDPKHFGIIHGDVNPSNYYWDATIGMPCMFDWDQVQLSWFLYDLSAPIWGVVTLELAGSPIDHSAVPQANSEQYTNWLLEGYEATGGNTVDREALRRMVAIRRELYRLFCKRALLELPAEHPMAQFCKFMTDFFDKLDTSQ